MGMPAFNIPTILTFSRILLIPVFLIVAPDHPVWGVILFSLASATDFLDGYIARRTGQITKFGIILDPIADKFLVISALIMLVDLGSLSAFVAIVIIIREFLVTALRVAALTKNIVIPAERGGKIKTALQIFAIIFLILRDSLFGIDLFPLGTLLIWAAMVMAVVSGVNYTIGFWRRIS